MKNGDPYPIYLFQTDTSGEKMFEEFYTHKENLKLDYFKNMGYIEKQKSINDNELEEMIQSLKSCFELADTSKKLIVEQISRFIPDFNHIETGKSLDQKM